MSVSLRIKLLKKALHFEKERNKTRHLDPFFKFAEELCIEWFGVPADTSAPSDIITWHRSMLIPPGGLFNQYMFLLALSEFDCRNYLDLGAGMFHRVTRTLRELRSQRPVTDMLALLTAGQTLKEYGLTPFMRMVEQQALYCVAKPIRIALVATECLDETPDPFSDTLVKTEEDINVLVSVGKALLSAVGWPNMCQMIHYSSIHDWALSIDNVEFQQLATYILGVSQDGTTGDKLSTPPWSPSSAYPHVPK